MARQFDAFRRSSPTFCQVSRTYPVCRAGVRCSPLAFAARGDFSPRRSHATTDPRELDCGRRRRRGQLFLRLVVVRAAVRQEMGEPDEVSARHEARPESHDARNGTDGDRDVPDHLGARVFVGCLAPLGMGHGRRLPRVRVRVPRRPLHRARILRAGAAQRGCVGRQGLGAVRHQRGVLLHQPPAHRDDPRVYTLKRDSPAGARSGGRSYPRTPDRELVVARLEHAQLGREDPGESMNLESPVAAGWAALSILFLSGCNVVIQAPADLATVTAPAVAVNIGLPGLYQAGTFSARLNEADITSQFTVNTQSGSAAAGLTLTPGSYMLDVSACWGLNTGFAQAPPWPLNGCSSSRASFAVVQPSLVLGPSGLALPVSQSGTATVQAIPAPGAALAIVLSASPASILLAPSAATVPANSAAPVNIPVQGVGPGSAAISASATGYTSASLNVSVRPLITQLSPAGGPPGTAVAVTGAGFVAPVSVRF